MELELTLIRKEHKSQNYVKHILIRDVSVYYSNHYLSYSNRI